MDAYCCICETKHVLFTDSCIMYKFCPGFQTSLISPKCEFLHGLVLGGISETRHNLGIWGVGGRAASPSIDPGPFLGASGFLSYWGKAPPVRTFSYVQLCLLEFKEIDFPHPHHGALRQEKRAFIWLCETLTPVRLRSGITLL